MDFFGDIKKPISIAMRTIDDFHCHFRSGSLLCEVVPETAKYATRAIAMPNTKPAILTGADVSQYYREILEASAGYLFQPLMTIKICDSTTPEIIRLAHLAGAIAGKIYPVGTTTNSDEGMSSFFSK